MLTKIPADCDHEMKRKDVIDYIIELHDVPKEISEMKHEVIKSSIRFNSLTRQKL